jgi:uncharacterized OB-fold protein
VTATPAPPSGALSLGEFFEGVRAGRVAVMRCGRCGELAVPPRAFCPACHGTTWARAWLAGDGEVTSYTVIRVSPAALAAEAPYAIAVVRMSEGVSLTGRVTGIAPETIRIGLPVRLIPPRDPAATPPVVTFGSQGDAPAG